MNIQKTDEKKTAKKQLFETIRTKLDSALAEYKGLMGEEKFSGYLKKTSKNFASEIGREMKKELQRKKKEVKNGSKVKAEKEK